MWREPLAVAAAARERTTSGAMTFLPEKGTCEEPGVQVAAEQVCSVIGDEAEDLLMEGGFLSIMGLG
jgi:hypothetical protein